MKFRKIINNSKKTFFLLFILIILISINKYFFSIKSPIINNKEDNIVVHYIDVGQGDSILVQVNNKNLLIDSGPKDSKKDLFNYLNSLQIEKLDYVIMTHPHDDHIGNAAQVINTYHIENFYAPKVTSSTRCFENMIESLKSKNLKINIIKAGISSIDLGENTTVSVLSPIKNDYENLNNYSPILKIQYKNISFLFVGDAEKEIEASLLNNKDLKCDVLKVGHHGSSTSSSNDFIKKVNPSIAVISVGAHNDYNHPSKKTLDTLNKNNIKIFRTDINKTVVLYSDGYILKKSS